MKEKEIEKVFKALANRRRLSIIKILKNRKGMSVGEIAKEIKLSFKATSRHLSFLYVAEILDKEQRSLQVFYRINPECSKSISTILSIL